jgi:hypothetical protein
MVDEDTYDVVRPSDVDTLLISGQLDVATPPTTSAHDPLPYLPYGHRVVLQGIGHVASFYADQPAAGAHLVNTFFDSGRVDTSRYQRQHVDLTPSPTLSTYAKWLLALVSALILVAAAILGGTALRVRRHGRLGPVASGVLRSVGPLPLGLGGWAVGVLVVSTTMSSGYLDDPLLVTLSTGTPIALGLFLAWSDRDRPSQVETTSFGVALAAALLGARLGFSVVAPPAAVLTAIVGAGIGANLALLVVDLRGRPTERPAPIDDSTPAEERQPESPPVR